MDLGPCFEVVYFPVSRSRVTGKHVWRLWRSSDEISDACSTINSTLTKHPMQTLLIAFEFSMKTYHDWLYLWLTSKRVQVTHYMFKEMAWKSNETRTRKFNSCGIEATVPYQRRELLPQRACGYTRLLRAFNTWHYGWRTGLVSHGSASVPANITVFWAGMSYMPTHKVLEIRHHFIIQIWSCMSKSIIGQKLALEIMHRTKRITGYSKCPPFNTGHCRTTNALNWRTSMLHHGW